MKVWPPPDWEEPHLALLGSLTVLETPGWSVHKRSEEPRVGLTKPRQTSSVGCYQNKWGGKGCPKGKRHSRKSARSSRYSLCESWCCGLNAALKLNGGTRWDLSEVIRALTSWVGPFMPSTTKVGKGLCCGS
jgi:hypothetical protein